MKSEIEYSADFLKIQKLINQKDFKNAFLILIKISPYRSHDINYLELLSDVLWNLNDFENSIKTRKCLFEKTEKITDAFKLIKHQLKLNKRNEALDTCQYVLDNCQLNHDQLSKLNEWLISIYIAESDFEGLEEILNIYESEKTHHHNLEPMLQYAKSLHYIQLGQLDLFIDEIRTLVRKNSQFDLGWAALAMYHIQVADYELAFANLEMALEANPDNTTALKLLVQLSKKHKVSRSRCESIIDKLSRHLNIFNDDIELNKSLYEFLKDNDYLELAKIEKLKIDLLQPFA